MLTYDDTRHAYHDERQHYYRSVTGVLRAAGKLGSVEQWGNAEALARGQAVHALALAADHAGHWPGRGASLPWPRDYPIPPGSIVAHRGGRLVVEATSDDVSACVEAYWQWRCLFRPHWVLLERPLCRPDLDLAGTPDRIGILRGWPTVLEIKTGGQADWHGLQLVGYDLLDAGPMPRQRAALYLGTDGKFKFRTFNDPCDVMTFMLLL